MVYNFDENQIVTSGTDRKICYWEALDGSLIRQMDGSMSGAVNGMDIWSDGTKFVTGGDDKVTYTEARSKPKFDPLLDPLLRLNSVKIND